MVLEGAVPNFRHQTSRLLSGHDGDDEIQDEDDEEDDEDDY